MRITSATIRICLLLGILLAACSPPAMPTEASTEAVIATAQISTEMPITLMNTHPPPTDTPIPPTPTPTPSSSESVITPVVIDGQPDDWADYPVLLTDREGDTFKGGFDLKSVRAFTNDQYFYLLLDAYGDIGEYVQVDLDIDVDGDGNRDYMATFRPRTGRRDFGDFTSGKDVWGPMRGGSAAEGVVVEFEMPLTLIAGCESLTLMRIRVMNGICCAPGQWYVIDNMGPVFISRSNEREPTLAEKFERWLSLPLTGIASEPFAINDTDPALDGARGLFVNEDGTKAYIVGEFSGKLSWVNLDSTSSAFSKVTTIADDLFVPTDVAVNRAETVAYVTREIQNVVTRVDLMTGEVATVTTQLGQPTNIALSQDENEGYVVDMQRGRLNRVNLTTGAIITTTTKLGKPFAVAVNRVETLAYITTTPARPGDYPAGDLLRVNLKTGRVFTVAAGIVKGASGITLSADERLVVVTEFGNEGDCDGRLSVINVNPTSANFGKKTVLVTGLCGAHDVRLNRAETILYFVEVDSSRFSAIQVNLSAITPTPNVPPAASIMAPAEDAEFVEDTAIVFQGQATDLEDGPLTDDTLVCTSDRDGQIGVGTSFTASLSTGDHTITLTATDSGGLSGTASVHIRVLTAGITGGPPLVNEIRSSALNDPVGVAVNAAGTMAYVTERGSGEISAVVIDPTSPNFSQVTMVADQSLDGLQVGIALNPEETALYVVENWPGELSRVDLSSGAISTVVSGLTYPHGVALDASGTFAYVTDENGVLSKVRLSTGEVTTVTTGLNEPMGLALNDDGSFAYVTELRGRSLQKVNLFTGAVTQVAYFTKPTDVALYGDWAYIVDQEPELARVNLISGQKEVIHAGIVLPFGVALSPDGGTAYVVKRQSGELVAIDVDSGDAASINVPKPLSTASGVALNVAGTWAYVTEYLPATNSGCLRQVDVDQASPTYGSMIVVTEDLEDIQLGIAVSTDESTAWVLEGEQGRLRQVDLASGTVTTVASGLPNPHGLVVNRAETTAYVTGGDALHRVDLASGQVQVVTSGMHNPHGVALNISETMAYVVTPFDGQLHAINLSTGIRILVTGNLIGPTDVVLTADDALAYVIECQGHRLSVVNLASGAITPIVVDGDGLRVPYGLELSPDGKLAYVADQGAEYLLAVDLTGQWLRRVYNRRPFQWPEGITINAAETLAYVADAARNTVSVVNIDSDSPTYQTITLLADGGIEDPAWPHLNHAETFLYVVETNPGELSRINLADGTVETLASGLDRPSGLALNGSETVAWITTGDGEFGQVDLTSGEYTLIAGGFLQPRGLAISADETTAYVADSGAGTISAVALSDGHVTTLAGGLSEPIDPAIDSTGTMAYFVEQGVFGKLSRIELATGAVTRLIDQRFGGLNGPSSLALNGDDTAAYVTEYMSGAVLIVDLTVPAVGQAVVEALNRPSGLDINMMETTAYVTEEFTNRLKRIDLASGEIHTVAIAPHQILFIEVTADETSAYATMPFWGNLARIDLATGALYIVTTGLDRPWELELNAAEDTAYVACYNSGEIIAVDLATGDKTVVATTTNGLTPPAGPSGLALNADETQLYTYVVPMGDQLIYDLRVVDIASGTVTTIATIDALANSPHALVVDEAEAYAYIVEVPPRRVTTGTLRRVDIDPTSPTYGQWVLIPGDWGEPIDIELGMNDALAYITNAIVNQLMSVD